MIGFAYGAYLVYELHVVLFGVRDPHPIAWGEGHGLRQLFMHE